ncbi:MAG: NAD(+) diphosphatase [Eubacterium sp.]|nr:NAD(+) diphosphatase [Eubacterium sp.]
MIQDIYPSKLDNSYKNIKPEDKDFILVFNDEGKAYVGDVDGEMSFLTYADCKSPKKVDSCSAVYLFSIDDKRYFLLGNKDAVKLQKLGFEYYTIRELRDRYSRDDVNIYAAFTAYHIWKWYSDNTFCGKCGSELKHSENERALVCADCGNVIYPRINPAVIVGVTKGDSLLLTRYRRGFAHNALVAGFTEIGETLEETVAREVMEETGVKVKNIRYYKSQPWGMAQDMLVGFYCEADGDGEIHMDENELKYAEWVKREDIELQPNNLSLTNEMMRVFKEGK